MELFSFPVDEVITSYEIAEPPAEEGRAIKVRAQPAGGREHPNLSADRGSPIDLEKQFILFQLSSQLEGPSVLESARVDPKIEGSSAEPDVLVNLELLSLQIAKSEGIDPEERATMRIN